MERYKKEDIFTEEEWFHSMNEVKRMKKNHSCDDYVDIILNSREWGPQVRFHTVKRSFQLFHTIHRIESIHPHDSSYVLK
jgi:hypothetical protein